MLVCVVSVLDWTNVQCVSLSTAQNVETGSSIAAEDKRLEKWMEEA